MAKSKNWIIYLGLIFTFFCSSFKSPVSREELVKQIYTQVGVKEATGHNDGPQVEAYLRSVGLTKGQPWCASFCSWIFQQFNIPNPKSGYAPLWFPKDHIIYKLSDGIKGVPEPGDVFGIYFASKGRIAHVGFVIEWGEKYAVTIEGNADADATEGEKSREGNGCFKKKRLKRQIYAVSSWL